MILRPDVTRCPACGRFVYAIDDLFPLPPSAAASAVAPELPSGLYHYACLLAHPKRAPLFAALADGGRADWPADDEFLVTVARDDQFGLTLRPAVGRYTLRLITHNRQVDFHRPAHWQTFARAAADPPVPPTDATGHVGLKPVGDGWELAQRHVTPITFDLSATDFAKLRARLGGDTEVGRVCQQLGLKLIDANCPPDRLVGAVVWPDSPPAAGPVTVTVRVEWWARTGLSGKDVTALRQFLRQLK